MVKTVDFINTDTLTSCNLPASPYLTPSQPSTRVFRLTSHTNTSPSPPLQGMQGQPGPPGELGKKGEPGAGYDILTRAKVSLCVAS